VHIGYKAKTHLGVWSVNAQILYTIQQDLKSVGLSVRMLGCNMLNKREINSFSLGVLSNDNEMAFLMISE